MIFINFEIYHIQIILKFMLVQLYLTPDDYFE